MAASAAWLAAAALQFGGAMPAHAAGASLYLKPAKASYQTGATLSVDVRLNTAGENVNAVQVDLTYPATLVEYVSADTSASAFTLDAISKGAGGKVQIARGKIGGLAGDVLVATVSFKALRSGTATIGVAKSSAAPRSAGATDALTSREGASVTLSGPAVAGSAPQTTGADNANRNPKASASPAPRGLSIIPLNLFNSWNSPLSLALIALVAVLLVVSGILWRRHRRPKL